MFGDSVPGSVPLLVLRRGLADDAAREAAAEDPVLALVPLDPVLLPGPGPEQGRGNVREAAGEETPDTAVPLHGLPVAADDAGPAAVDLAADAGIPVTLAEAELPLVLHDVGHLVGRDY